MCLAAPYRVIEVMENGKAMINVDGTSQEINTLMVPEVKVGDYVITYLGSTLAIIDEEEAKAALLLFQQMNNMEISGYIPHIYE